jgi:hypothetical protein
MVGCMPARYAALVKWTRCALLVAVVALELGLPLRAQDRRVRRLFEPTDLELEEVGMLEVDLQFGAIRGHGAARVVVPDFEFDLGVLPNLEVDLDGAYAIEGPETGSFAFDHAAPDSLWTAAKLGLYDANDTDAHTAFALGVQCGPKWPVAPHSHGVGFESVLLVGTALARTHLVWNAGAFVDSDPDPTPGRPIGLEIGVDMEVDLGHTDTFALQGGLSEVHFLSHDSDQLLVTAGIAWSPIAALDLSLLGLVGVLANSDRYGVLIGVAPKLQLFH